MVAQLFACADSAGGPNNNMEEASVECADRLYIGVITMINEAGKISMRPTINGKISP